MARTCLSPSFNASFFSSLIAVGFSLFVAVDAVPVVAADGDLDTSFGTGGKVVTSILSQDDFAHSVAIQSDGKIVVAGDTKNGTADSIGVARYNADGTLDTSFDGDGKKISNFTNASYNDYVRAVAIQPDGKIVVAGSSGELNEFDDFALIRFNADGSLDTNFGTGGSVVTSILSQDDIVHSVAIQSDGKIVVAGDTKNGTADSIGVARYNSDGTLDTSFDGDGKKISNFTNASYNDYVRAVAIQPDGKLVVAGSSGELNKFDDFALIRFNADGSLDTNFGTGGSVVTSILSQDDIVHSVAIQSDGKIVVAGDTKNGTADSIGVARYNSDGTLDTSFDGDGKVITNSNNNGDHAYSVAIQSDGKIVLAGASDNTGDDDFALYRYDTDGSLDTGFGTGGKVVTAIGGGDDIGTSVAIQSDGKIVVAGHSQNGGYYDFALVRYAGTPPASTNAVPSVPVPTLPTILLMVLSGLLTLFGFYRVRASK